jgi:DNA primase
VAIDFKKVKVREVLDYYSIRNLREIGDEIQFSCPFPEHKRGDQNPSSSINTENGKWHCFGCGRSGSLVSFISEFEGIPYSQASRWLREAYGGGFKFGTKEKSLVQSLREITERRSNTPRSDHLSEDVLRQFEVDWDVVYDEELRGREVPKVFSYLFRRGFEPATLNDFEIGFDPKSGRLTIPYRNSEGQLVGFKGRAGNSHDQPKYIGIGDGEKPRYGFPRLKTADYVFALDTAHEELCG